ncbi:unnamed protein product [Schistosoma margrebowiei]|uniref:Uncharacterized protein n=1 Tax=Schistosoma margrebowiei TaxID=48269 RepID=A0A3P7ZY83_9TREM|nr:unnamed protein product [Schistosoma margrebowiei]
MSKLPQQVQAVPVSFQNNALDELAASVDRILKITKSSTTEIFFGQRKASDDPECHNRVMSYTHAMAGKERCSLRGADIFIVPFLFFLYCTSVSYSKERRSDAARLNLVLGESGRPSHLLYIQPFSSGNVQISGSSLDELIFDRTQMRKFNDYDVVSLKSGVATDVNDVLVSNPINYLVSSYRRACAIKQTNALSQIVEDCRKSIVRQIVLLLLVDAESDNPESSTNLFDIIYQALCTDDGDQIAYIQKMFDEVLNHLESESLSDVSIEESCPQSALNSLRPLVNRLLIQLRNIYYSSVQSPTVVNSFLNKQLVGARERVLFCPQRRPLLIMTIWLSKYSVTAQVCLFQVIRCVQYSNHYQMVLLFGMFFLFCYCSSQ